MADNTSALLREAADTVSRALRQLNTKHGRCKECGSRHFEDLVEARIHESLESIPMRLINNAEKLDHARHDAAREETA
jgi:hypothetical protein